MTEVVKDRVEPPVEPFPGIQPFAYSDRCVFFARQEEVRTLIRLVVTYRGVLVYGNSQRGKSSLLNAGLIPEAIANGFQPERIRVQPIRGAECIVDRIAVSSIPGDRRALPSVFDVSDTGVRVLSLQQLIGRVRAAASAPPLSPGEFPEPGSSVRPLLIFDQFEEWVTAFEEAQARGAEEAVAIQAEILQEIASLVNDHTLRVKVVLVFREDYLSRFEPFFLKCPTLPDHYLRLAPLDRRKLYKLIRGPFMRYPGHYQNEISPSLARTIQRQFADTEPGAEVSLTELQIVCRTLVKRPEFVKHFAAGGSGVQGILREYFVTRLEELPAHHREPAVALLSCLVTTAGTRRTVDRDNLLTLAGVTEADRELFISTLTDLEQQARLIRKERRRDLDYFEIASEFLVDWIKEQGAARRSREEQRRLVEERERAQADAEVMRKRLEEQTLRAAAEAAAAAETKLRLEAQAREAEQQRRADIEAAKANTQRRLTKRMTILAVISFAMFGVAAGATYVATRLARDQLGRARLLVANAQLPTDPQFSTLLSLLVSSDVRSRADRALAESALARSVREASHLVSTTDRGDKTLRSMIWTASSSGASLILAGDKELTVLTGEDFSKQASVIALSGPTGPLASCVLQVNNGLVIVNPDGSFGHIDLTRTRPELRPTAGPPRADRAEPETVDRQPVTVECAVDQTRGRLVVTQDTPWERRLAVADVRTGAWLTKSSLGSTEAVQAVDLSADGRRYAIIDASGRVTVKDLGVGPARRNQFAAGVTVLLSDDGDYALVTEPGEPNAAGGLTAKVRVWNIVTDKLTALHLPAGGQVKSRAFSRDSREVAAVLDSGFVQVWTVATGEEILASAIPASNFVFSSDSSELLTWDASNVAQLWSLTSGSQILRLAGHLETIVAAAISPADGPIVTLSETKMKVWSREGYDRKISTGDRTLQLVPNPKNPEATPPAPVAAVSSNGESVATVGTDRRLRIRAVKGTVTEYSAAPDDVLALSYSHDDHMVAGAMKSGAVIVWQVDAPQSLGRLLDDGRGPITAVRFAADDRAIAYAVQISKRDADGLIHQFQDRAVVKDLTTGRVVAESDPVESRISALTLAGDGRSCLVGLVPRETTSYGTAVAPTSMQGPFQELPMKPAAAPVASSSGRIDVDAASLPMQLGQAGISDDRALRVRTLGTQIVVSSSNDRDGVAVPFRDTAKLVAVAPDGRHFAAAGELGALKLFAPESRAELVVLQGGGPPVTALAFDTAGKYLVSIRQDGVVNVYPVALAALKEKAESIVAERKLTKDDCARYNLGDECSVEPSAWRLLWSQMSRGGSGR